MKSRMFIAIALAGMLLALTFNAMPAAAGRPAPKGGTAVINAVNETTCQVTVTYTWQGFSGATAFVASVSLFQAGNVFSMTSGSSGLVSGKAGTFTTVLQLDAANRVSSRAIHARGDLSKNAVAVSGSSSPPSNFVNTTCGEPA